MPDTHYPHAPIAEAVFDVGVSPLDDDVVDRLGSFEDDHYPERVDNIVTEAEVHAGPLAVVTTGRQLRNGYRLTSTDGLQIAQLRTDGFTFSRLAPYEHWDAFQAEAFRLLTTYLRLAQPESLTRLALRYINQIDLPRGRVDLESYLRTRPELSPDMPSATTGFFLTIDVPMPQQGAMCRVVQTILPPDPAGHARLVLDIDVFRPVRLPPSASDNVAECFQALRRAKNIVFEASITDNARDLFR